MREKDGHAARLTWRTVVPAPEAATGAAWPGRSVGGYLRRVVVHHLRFRWWLLKIDILYGGFEDDIMVMKVSSSLSSLSLSPWTYKFGMLLLLPLLLLPSPSLLDEVSSCCCWPSGNTA